MYIFDSDEDLLLIQFLIVLILIYSEKVEKVESR